MRRLRLRGTPLLSLLLRAAWGAPARQCHAPQPAVLACRSPDPIHHSLRKQQTTKGAERGTAAAVAAAQGGAHPEAELACQAPQPEMSVAYLERHVSLCC